MDAAAEIRQPADLERRFAAGDLDAFETLFRRHQGEVYAWTVRIVRDAALAEDATIETFWRIYRARARFDSRHEFGAWARRIATNVAIDFLKARSRQAAGFENRGDSGGAGPHSRPAARGRHSNSVPSTPGEIASRCKPGADRRGIERTDRRRAGNIGGGGEIARPPVYWIIEKESEEIAGYTMKPADNELREMLRQALPPVQTDQDIHLWPRMLHRLDQGTSRMSWVDRVSFWRCLLA